MVTITTNAQDGKVCLAKTALGESLILIPLRMFENFLTVYVLILVCNIRREKENEALGNNPTSIECVNTVGNSIKMSKKLFLRSK